MQRITLSFIRSVSLTGHGVVHRPTFTSMPLQSACALSTTTQPKKAAPAARSTKPTTATVKKTKTDNETTVKTTTTTKVIQPGAIPGVRINKCFPEFSRTQVDRLIASGRVTVNGKPAELGTRLHGADVVMLDGTTEVSWAQYVEKQAGTPYPEGLAPNNGFVYIKYFKPAGVTTTTGRDPNGVLATGHFKDVKLVTARAGEKSQDEAVPVDRLLPVGRLDNESTGMLLLTSDPRLPAWVLGANTGCAKVYEVFLDRTPKAEDLAKWQAGVPLTTASSTGKVPRTHPTLPCKVRILMGPSEGVLDTANEEVALLNRVGKGCWVQFTLKEGRNRQIRRMVHALGYTVRALHRASFCGVKGDGLQAGKWAYLTPEELQLLRRRK